MVIRENFGRLLEPGLRKIWGDTYANYGAEYSQVFKVEESTKATETDVMLTTFGLIPRKAQGKSISYDDVYQGWVRQYTHETYGRGFAVARELLEDDQYRRIAQMPKALARSCNHTVEILCANVLNNAFNSAFPGGDGVPLCANNHPLIGGGTFSNLLSTAADLSITSFEAMLVLISEFVDDRGLKIAARPVRLLVTPYDEFMAQYILKSEKLPGTANNNINPAKGLIPYTVMHWLTDPDAWFIQTDVDNGLTFFWRRRPEFSNESDFDSEVAKYKVTFRCSVGWTDPRCIAGTPGA